MKKLFKKLCVFLAIGATAFAAIGAIRRRPLGVKGRQCHIVCEDYGQPTGALSAL